MTRKILSVLLAVLLAVSCVAFTVSADENAFYVEAGATGDGSEDNPFGTLQEAILALGGKDGTIYVYGALNMTGFNAPAWEGMVTVTAVNADTVITLDDGKSSVFKGDITFKDIKFDLGKNTHFNPHDSLLVMDGGKDSHFNSFMHLSMYGSTIVEKGDFVLESGRITTLYTAGGYCTSLANGVMGDTNITINGGEVNNINICADAFMATQTGISIGGNYNLIINGGTVGKIQSGKPERLPEIMGAMNIIFNNGMQPSATFDYPAEQASGGVFVIKSAEGGMITPVEGEIGVFNVKANSGKIAVINGEQVLNGNVTLEAGETEVTWVDGEQAEEKTEIKLVIGKAEIVTNGEAKALDVPAQIIDSRTMVPLRAIFEALGASVEWDDATKTVTSKKDDTTVKLTIGTPAINVNGTDKALDVAAQIVESRTMVPARAVAEAYGCEVAWDDATKTVTITK